MVRLPQAIDLAALEACLHTMIEKPISAHQADAECLIACAKKHPKQVFAGMFQLRFELADTRGKLVLENNKLTFTRNDADMIEFSKTAKIAFGKPETWNCEIPFADAGNSHGILMQNFVDAILDGTPLIAPGDDGMGSVELANVLLYSSLIDSPVKLPLDGAAWEVKLNELIANSKTEKKVVKIANDDFTKSFHR